MVKKFNVNGCCFPEEHYMVDISGKFNQVMKLIEQGEYFTINRPRQYGKTTMLNMLSSNLAQGKYLPVFLSFEGIGDELFENEATFSTAFVRMFSKELQMICADTSDLFLNATVNVKNLETLSSAISIYIKKLNKDIIILIDEIDKSSNNQLFLSFLGMLRDKYLKRRRQSTFKSVILAGVHDVKSLKLRIRDGSEAKLNSPWNIAADFNVDMSFNPAEIKTMLLSYSEDTGVNMDFNAVAYRIFYYTSGYPFLVSKICKNIAEEEAGQNPGYNPNNWTIADVDWSFSWLTRATYTTTNFDDLVKNLENNQDLYELAYKIIFGTEAEGISFSTLNPIVNQGLMYGIFKEQDEKVAIHNRVYEQVLYDYMRSKKETSPSKYSFNGYVQKFEDSAGFLDMKKTMLKFQEFMKEHYSWRDEKFLEREGRLIFLSFLKPIVNGKGSIAKEPVIGDERRIDIFLTYGKQQEVIEAKVWRGQTYHERGMEQLSDYLDMRNLKQGYLLIFDFNKNKQYKTESIKFKGREIFAVWV
jgi:hypothetical protein